MKDCTYIVLALDEIADLSLRSFRDMTNTEQFVKRSFNNVEQRGFEADIRVQISRLWIVFQREHDTFLLLQM